MRPFQIGVCLPSITQRLVSKQVRSLQRQGHRGVISLLIVVATDDWIETQLAELLG